MDGLLDAQRRCLAALQASCAADPGAHANQLAALEREAALAAGAAGIEDFLSASGNLFELARAGSLDRAVNAARSAVAVGDRWRARAAAIEHRTALGATAAGWGAALTAAGTEAAAARSAGEDARSAYTGLLLLLIELHGPAHAVMGEDLAAEAALALEGLIAVDPGFSLEAPEYRARTPWRATGVLAGWFAALGAPAGPAPEPEDPLPEIENAAARWRDALAAAGPVGAEAAPPGSAEEVAAPYAALAEMLPVGDPTRAAAEAAAAAARTEPSGPAALARLVEEGRLVELSAAPLRARARDALARQAFWPDPIVARHWQTLLARLEDVASPTALDAFAGHADACFAAEAGWNRAFLASLFAPLRSALSGRATDVAERLLGVADVRSLERTRDFVENVVLVLAPLEDGALGSYEGEGGADLLRDARWWLAEHPGGSLRERLTAPPGDAAAALVMWGEPFADASFPPPRPDRG
jgi:hypothetical protein